MDNGRMLMHKEGSKRLGRALVDDNTSNDDHSSIYQVHEVPMDRAAQAEASELVWQHSQGHMRRLSGPYRNNRRPDASSDQQTQAWNIPKVSRNRRSFLTKLGITVPEEPLRYSTCFPGSQAPQEPWPVADEHAHHSQRFVTKETGFPAPPKSQPRTTSIVGRGIRQKTPEPGSLNEGRESTWGEPKTSTAERHPARFPPINRQQSVANRLVTRSISGSAADKFRPAHRGIGMPPATQLHKPHYVTTAPDLFSDHCGVTWEKRLEIRSKDIRDATSMKLKDRSSRLPTPSAVSDHPGRPIVSFDGSWKATGATIGHHPNAAMPKELGWTEGPRKEVSSPAVVATATLRTASSQEDPPTLVLPDPGQESRFTSNIPLILKTADNAASDSPLPRPLSAAVSSKTVDQRESSSPRCTWPHIPTASNGPTTICHQCGLCIRGRFMSVYGMSERFHPHCFVCFSCGTSLEALEVSPEPELHRAKRLDRIQRRAQGETLEDVPGQTSEEDGDERLRFYCYLDWQELFAPKCKHCKTPILGEHIIALGAHWHYGHFFCAECGDPFEQGMTHIEKDGYAWCIRCQTRRTERQASKCKKCGLAVIGQCVRTLGAEWHENCLRCAICNGKFNDGAMFPKEEQGIIRTLCTRCRIKELRA